MIKGRLTIIAGFAFFLSSLAAWGQGDPSALDASTEAGRLHVSKEALSQAHANLASARMRDVIELSTRAARLTRSSDSDEALSVARRAKVLVAIAKALTGRWDETLSDASVVKASDPDGALLLFARLLARRASGDRELAAVEAEALWAEALAAGELDVARAAKALSGAGAADLEAPPRPPPAPAEGAYPSANDRVAMFLRGVAVFGSFDVDVAGRREPSCGALAPFAKDGASGMFAVLFSYCKARVALVSGSGALESKALFEEAFNATLVCCSSKGAVQTAALARRFALSGWMVASAMASPSGRFEIGHMAQMDDGTFYPRMKGGFADSSASALWTVEGMFVPGGPGIPSRAAAFRLLPSVSDLI